MCWTRAAKRRFGLFNAVQLTRARQAGNGRLARPNKLEEANFVRRALDPDETADLSYLCREDFDLSDVNG